MAESIVTDWLADYSSLETSEIRSFAAQHENYHEIASALYTILNEKNKYPDLLHPVCNQFYSFYRSNEIELRRFTLQFVPILIYLYLNSVAQGDKKSCRSVETLLISIYNIEVSNDDGQPKIVSFRMPVLAQASIYHEEKNLHASDLRRWEDNSNKEVKWGPLPQVESLNAQNRLKVMTAILFSFNQQLSLINKSALYHLCRVSSQLVNQGFSKPGHAHRSSYGNDPSSSMVAKPLPRIPVSSQFLLEILHAIYFAMFNEFASIAIQTVDDIHNRVCYEMFPEVILVTNAIKNSLHANPSGQPSDGPMGISVALTPATTTVTVSKSMITNASFRTKKLPDDIPIQGPKDEANTLLSISEENEQEAQLGSRGSALRTSKDNPKVHKVPFSGFKKFKDKDKEKETKIDKNGAANETKDIITKKIITKEKTSRNSLYMTQTSGGDGPENEKNNLNHQVIVTKVKIETNGLTNNSEVVSVNGISSDEKGTNDSFNNSFDNNSDSIDSSMDLSIGPQRPSIVTVDKTHGIQVSQV